MSTKKYGKGELSSDSIYDLQNTGICRIAEYIHEELPGDYGDWWWSVGWCNVGPHASLGVDRSGKLRHLLNHDLFKEPFIFDCKITKDDWQKTIFEPIFECVEQAKEAIKQYKKTYDT